MSFKKYLILKGCAGLGNRLYTLCAAIAYAKRTNRILYVDWSDGQFDSKGVNAFFKYFELNDVEHISSLADINNLSALPVYPESWSGNLDKGIYDCFEYLHNDRFPTTIQKVLRKLNVQGSMTKAYGFWQPKGLYQGSESVIGSLLPVANRKCFPTGSQYKDSLSEDVVVFADFAPPPTPECFRKYIKLKAEVQEIVTAYAEKLNLGKNAVGIHVRATDKKPTSEIHSIFTKIKALKLNDPIIFLATDNTEVAELFSANFDHIVTFAHDLPDVQAGMGIHQIGFRTGNGQLAAGVFRQSLMDMWLLAECEYLFYQGNSTFSVISSYLHSDYLKVFDWQS